MPPFGGGVREENMSNEQTTEEQLETHPGVCLECERFTVALGPTGLCEGCVMQAQIDAMEESER